jgi:hypothetical protein
MPIENDTPLSALGEALAGYLLEQILERGLTLPIYGIAVDKLGSVTAMHFIQSDYGVECRVVAEHLPPEGMALPVSIVCPADPRQKTCLSCQAFVHVPHSPTERGSSRLRQMSYS